MTKKQTPKAAVETKEGIVKDVTTKSSSGFSYPEKNASDEVKKEFIKQAVDLLSPIIIAFINVITGTIGMNEIRTMMAMSIIWDEKKKEIMSAFGDALMNDQKLKAYWDEMMMLKYENIWEDFSKENLPLFEELKKASALFKEGSGIEEVIVHPSLEIIDESTIIGKVKTFISWVKGGSDEEETPASVEECDGDQSTFSFSQKPLVSMI